MSTGFIFKLLLQLLIVYVHRETADVRSLHSQGPFSHKYFSDWGLGGGGPSDFLGLQILAKSDFFGSMKDTRPGFFWGHEKKWRFSWVAKKGLRDFFGYAKKSCGFFG